MNFVLLVLTFSPHLSQYSSMIRSCLSREVRSNARTTTSSAQARWVIRMSQRRGLLVLCTLVGVSSRHYSHVTAPTSRGRACCTRQHVSIVLTSERKLSGKKQSKERVQTILVGANANGTDKLPLVMIGKSKQPRCFNKVNPSLIHIHYLSQPKAWMTTLKRLRMCLFWIN